MSEAHKILDNVLKEHPNNAFALYAKGLAYYNEEEFQKSIEYFEKSRQLDPSADLLRAEIMLEKAQAKLSDLQAVNHTSKSLKKTTKSPVKQSPPQVIKNRSPPTSRRNVRRFGCEICGHFFGKKYNLDRHNKILHKRNTPENFPTTPPSKKVAEVPATEVKKDSSPVRSPGSEGNVECPLCLKQFRRNSINRHMEIHSGEKKHQCGICEMAFMQKSDLARHMVSPTLS